MRSEIQQYMGRCKFFTGIQNEACEKGINYRKLVGGDYRGWARKIPCTDGFDSDEKADCASREFPTKTEAEEHEIVVEAHIAKVLKALINGECPICHKSTKQRQVGNCVYGTCGHRLYQGTVNPEFAE
jgi:hypothetical protein